MLGTALGLAAAWSGIKIHDYLTGNDLVRDLYDEFRLNTRSLLAWDDFWKNNPCRSDLIVCLTTTPSRVERLGRVLKSLLYQTRSPQKIRLHLPEFSRREGRAYPVPAFLKMLASVEVVRCQDEGPATKLLPALRDLGPDQKIVIVDDDKMYPPDLVEHFHRCAVSSPDVAVGSCGWVVPVDRMDRPTTLWMHILETPNTSVKCSRLRSPRQVDVLHGYAGYLVRPRFFDLASISDYSQAPAAAVLVDDVWISAHCLVKKYVFPAPRLCFHWPDNRFFYNNSLNIINNTCGPEHRNNTRMFKYFSDRWMLPASPE